MKLKEKIVVNEKRVENIDLILYLSLSLSKFWIRINVVVLHNNTISEFVWKIEERGRQKRKLHVHQCGVINCHTFDI